MVFLRLLFTTPTHITLYALWCRHSVKSWHGFVKLPFCILILTNLSLVSRLSRIRHLSVDIMSSGCSCAVISCWSRELCGGGANMSRPIKIVISQLIPVTETSLEITLSARIYGVKKVCGSKRIKLTCESLLTEFCRFLFHLDIFYDLLILFTVSLIRKVTAVISHITYSGFIYTCSWFTSIIRER